MANTNENLSPGVFRGSTRLAAATEISSLRNELTGILAGPSNSLSENGYIPWKFKNDGSVDVESLFPDLITQFKEDSGLKVFKENGIELSEGIKSIQFSGNYVSLDIDKNGGLIVNIDELSKSIPRFNTSTYLSNGTVSELSGTKNVIIPDTSKSIELAQLFGSWSAGETHKAIVQSNPNYDYIELTTLGPIFASSKNTFFEIKIYDAYNNIKSSFISKSIDENTKETQRLEPSSSNNSRHIYIYITDFKEETAGYSFIPKFKINLAKIITDGGRFKFEIIHHDDVNSYKYISDNILYVMGKTPYIQKITYKIDTDDNTSNTAQYVWVSGIKYLKAGNIIINLTAKNLNNIAAVEDKFDYQFNFINDTDTAVISAVNYTLDIEGDSSWKINLPIKKDIIFNEVISGYINAKNAFGSSDTTNINMRILINSLTSLEVATNLYEPFSDEVYRLMSDLGDETWDSEQDLTTYDNGNALIVIPGKGVMYPFGDWSQYLPYGSPNYENTSNLINEKYFVRQFTGNSNKKFGGIFVFGGITKNDFLNERISAIFTPDNGLNWFSLKDIRNSDVKIQRNNNIINAKGVLTNIKEENGLVYVSWSYPSSSVWSSPIRLKFGMKPTSPYCISSIRLLNLDGSEDW